VLAPLPLLVMLDTQPFDPWQYLEAGAASGQRDQRLSTSTPEQLEAMAALERELRQHGRALAALAVAVRGNATISSPVLLDLTDRGARSVISAADLLESDLRRIKPAAQPAAVIQASTSLTVGIPSDIGSHCSNGPARSEYGVYLRPDGGAECRKCRTESARRSASKSKANKKPSPQITMWDTNPDI